MITFTDLVSVCEGELLQLTVDKPIQTLLTDSRKVVVSEGSLFFAMTGERHNGHLFLQELYRRGLRQFIIEKPVDITAFPEANFLRVKSSLTALQKIAAHHRRQFQIPVVGITGSNGKTIIKEWLFQMLSPDLRVVKNPGSYNSQTGVPLSVWQIQPHHELGIFEAGISKPGEMVLLEKIIQPTIGIFCNLGTAHDEGFSSREEKAREKLKLFSHTSFLIYCKDHEIIDALVTEQKIQTLSWGQHARADIRLMPMGNDRFEVTFQEKVFMLPLPFRDAASQENAFHAVAFLLHQQYNPATIQERLFSLKPVAMRLELKQGLNRCLIIDDSYNNDLAGLKISMDFLKNQQKKKKTLILSDLLQSGLTDEKLIQEIKTIIGSGQLQKFIGIGPLLKSHRTDFLFGSFYNSTEEFLQQQSTDEFADEIVLVKGARPFQFERIVQRLQRKVHGTVMEIDLTAMVDNLNYFKSRLGTGTKIMAMVKAFAYGSGSEEVANLLQYHRVDYLGVAYADEGIELRKNNISLPIMVMNPSEESFALMLEYQLEPEMYSLRILQLLIAFLEGRHCTVHLKLDTGMHRLGFEEGELGEVMRLLVEHGNIRVASIFSHLSGADAALHDGFTQQQAETFVRMAECIEKSLRYQPLRHLLNSPGILRFPQYQFNMVRLGIGLYGVDPTEEGKASLKPVATLKTIISQIKKINPGETIGYGRKGKAKTEITLATLAIGYADGFSRSFSQGKGKVLIQGTLAPVIGNVCMDMTMVDITGIATTEGDEAIIFGPGLPIQQLAHWSNTIPYEILTNTSERVKRVFFAESI